MTDEIKPARTALACASRVRRSAAVVSRACRVSATGSAARAGAEVPQPAPTQQAPLPGEAGATIYQIDPQASILHIFVYRAGTFARLGHNHVVTSKSVNGRVWMRPQFPRLGFRAVVSRGGPDRR